MKLFKSFLTNLLIAVVVLSLASSGALASSIDRVEMVKNINSGGSSEPTDLIIFNNILYFNADDGVHGSELWKTDGTDVGTVMIKDINPNSFSYPSSFTDSNNVLYFRANDGTNGNELWKTDGTDVGTVMIKDINPSGTSFPSFFINFNNVLYFSANDGTNGNELWKTDGTASGTVMVKDININGNASPSNFVNFNNTLYFRASDSIHGSELWTTDGTASGTVMVKDINISGNSFPSNFTDSNNTLYFYADDGANGPELWKTDGTASGTVMVKDINPNAGSYPSFLTNFNNTLYFRADDGTNYSELWKTDGTASGTVMVKDINSGGESFPSNFIDSNNTLYFNADDGVHGSELWKTDGTEVGTVMVKDINPWDSSYASSFTDFNNVLYFKADNGTGFELWKAYIDNAPVITITGSNPDSVCQQATYTCIEATALDDIDGDITPSIITTNNVNTANAGSYTVDYSVADSAGNITNTSRVVTVVLCTANGGGGVVVVTPTPLSQGDKLDFSINNNASVTNSNIVNISLNANPTTVSGYAISLDSNFTGESIVKYTPNATFTLPKVNGKYTIYLKYYSSTGHISNTISHSIEYKTTNIDTDNNNFWLDGTWIKTSDKSTIYFLDHDNIRHPYFSESIWYTYFTSDFSHVKIITDEQLASYPMGKAVPFNIGSLIKINSSPKVYLVGENNILKWITSETEIIKLYGINWNKLVKDLAETLYTDYSKSVDVEK